MMPVPIYHSNSGTKQQNLKPVAVYYRSYSRRFPSQSEEATESCRDVGDYNGDLW